MDNNFVEPKYGINAFHCPFCKTYAHMRWSQEYNVTTRSSGFCLPTGYEISIAICSYCDLRSIWLVITTNKTKKIIEQLFPRKLSAPEHHPDMPEELINDYEEAREVCAVSPRSAAALLRLLVQKLCKHLGEKGKNINEDIGSLVASGMPPEMQKAFDSIRVFGNESLHPGEIQIEEIEGSSEALFALINLIIDDRISRPKFIEETYKKIPQTIIDSINKRDKKP